MSSTPMSEVTTGGTNNSEADTPTINTDSGRIDRQSSETRNSRSYNDSIKLRSWEGDEPKIGCIL